MKNPRSASSSRSVFFLARPLASRASDRGSRWPARLHHRPPRDTVDVAEHRRDLDLGVLEQLLHPLHLPAPVRDQGTAVAGQIAQPADRRRVHQRRAAHAAFGHLRQPHRISAIRLGPPRHVLDLAGVDQPAVEPLGLQQVIDALPVITRRFHHHTLNTPLPQPDRHLQQRRGSGGIAPDLLHPPPRLTWVRHPHARLQRGLTQIQRRHPLHHQLDLVDLFHSRCPFHATEHNGGRPQESTEERIESDPRAHGNNAQLRQRLPGSNYFTGSPAPRTLDLGERPPPIFAHARRPHRGPITISRRCSVLLGPGRFGRRRRSPSQWWSSSHLCWRAIRRSGHPARRGGG